MSFPVLRIRSIVVAGAGALATGSGAGPAIGAGAGFDAASAGAASANAIEHAPANAITQVRIAFNRLLRRFWVHTDLSMFILPQAARDVVVATVARFMKRGAMNSQISHPSPITSMPPMTALVPAA